MTTPDLLAALEPFAEQHVAEDSMCHVGITTMAKCGRCSRIIAARDAIAKARGLEVSA